MHNKKIKILGVCLVIIVLLAATSTPVQMLTSIPDEIRMFEGKQLSFPFSLPVNGHLSSANPHVLQVEDNHVRAIGPGQADLRLKLGQVPLKQVKVNVLPDMKVYPGGQSIGVHLQSVGPLVVGHHFLNSDEGKFSPAEQAGLQIGDMILKVNGVEIKRLEQVSTYTNEAGKNSESLHLEVQRGKEKLELEVKPIYDEQEDTYRLGAYIRNTAAGVGTLTFVHPETMAYGALGHVISDADTQKPIVVREGAILESKVSAIEKGIRGGPGEKLSHIDQNKVLGDVHKNTPFGIFGHLNQPLKNGVLDEPLPVGLSEDVKEGKAHILTVIDGQKVEKYEIEIMEIMSQHFPATKGLIIKVTDPVLLEKTGGIIQGMSGSPIIQEGKLIGAVTHVFVNDPTSGYGCLIEWMLNDADLLHKEDEKPKAA